MAYGLMSLKDKFEGQAIESLARVSDEQEKYEAQRKEMNAAEDTQRMSAIATGAGIGTAILPGVGTAVGAAAGWLASEIF